MAAVENSNFHRLIAMHVGSKGSADILPSGAALAEIVLDHPLAEIFMGHRCRIGYSHGFSQREFALSGRRHNAIDHRIRERAATLDPFGQLRILGAGQSKDGLFKDVTIALQVIA